MVAMTVQPRLRRKPGPPATGKGTPVQVRLQPAELATVDDWRARWAAKTGKPISRPETLREMIRVLIRLGGLGEID